MEEASRLLDFERAAALRDRLADLRKVAERQKVVSTAREDLDVLGLAIGLEGALVQVFQVRGGKLVGREHFLLTAGADARPEENLEAFLVQHYAEAPQVPPLILLPAPVASPEAIASWLGERRGRRVRLAVPARGEKKQLVEMAMENAALLLEQERVRRSYAEEVHPAPWPGWPWTSTFPRRHAGSKPLTSAISRARRPWLPWRSWSTVSRRPRNTGGSVSGPSRGPTTSPCSRKPRAGVSGGVWPRGTRGRKAVSPICPILLLIDGGKGQLHAVLDELGTIGATPAILGLAKENEEIFLPGRSEPLVLPRDSEALYLLQRVRDEAHRFAVTYHRAVRAKGTRASVLDGITGIGPRRKQALLRQFGSVKRIMAASIVDLAAVEGMSRQAAEAVYLGLHKDDIP